LDNIIQLPIYVNRQRKNFTIGQAGSFLFLGREERGADSRRKILISTLNQPPFGVKYEREKWRPK
jgi:hypothetical protein